jgi:hypothetical protein
MHPRESAASRHSPIEKPADDILRPHGRNALTRSGEVGLAVVARSSTHLSALHPAQGPAFRCYWSATIAYSIAGACGLSHDVLQVSEGRRELSLSVGSPSNDPNSSLRRPTPRSTRLTLVSTLHQQSSGPMAEDGPSQVSDLLPRFLLPLRR